MTTPSLLVLGADAALAAAPATPVQLAHACLAAGFSAVIPATWGEELIAERVLDALSNSNTPLIQCSCPLVRRRLTTRSEDIASMTFCCAAPPVATAAYLRRAYAPLVVQITFAGNCPSGATDIIDRWLSPDELLTELAHREIRVASQPTEFDSILPPDRRRHYSDPGGIPSVSAVRHVPGAAVVELLGEDFAVELAQHLLSPNRAVIDIGVAVGCACSGALAGIDPSEARARVRAQEPPRSPVPVVDHEALLELRVVTPVAEVADASEVIEPRRQGPTLADPARDAASDGGLEMAEVTTAGSSRRSPPGNRAVMGAMPQARSSGRHLPRAYVARRRSSPKGLRQSGVRRQEEVFTATSIFGRFRVPLVIGVAVAVVAIAVWMVLKLA